MRIRSASGSSIIPLAVFLALNSRETEAFIHPTAFSAQSGSRTCRCVSFLSKRKTCRITSLWASVTNSGGGHTSTAIAGSGFIETELRGAAMRLHTRKQAPKEGTAAEAKTAPYVPTHEDYLRFLIDSRHIYRTFEEEVLPRLDAMAPFRNTGLERADRLDRDIDFMMQAYELSRLPPVGSVGLEYAELIRSIAASATGVPELMCHYYNFYFAHTAGGRIIGKQMAAHLLNKKTLEFYKWDGDLNKIKDAVKKNIEKMATAWTREEKDLCVAGTADAFKGGGGLNAYLHGSLTLK